MSRRFLLACLALITVSTLVAADDQDLSVSIARYTQIDLLLRAGALDSAAEGEQIRALARDLPEFYLGIVYDAHKARIGRAISLNLVTGGLGSILMGDVLFGTINQIGMAISLALAGVAIPLGPPTSQTLYSISQITSIVFTVSGIITPIIYGVDHNARLKDVLTIQ